MYNIVYYDLIKASLLLIDKMKYILYKLYNTVNIMTVILVPFLWPLKCTYHAHFHVHNCILVFYQNIFTSYNVKENALFCSVYLWLYLCPPCVIKRSVLVPVSLSPFCSDCLGEEDDTFAKIVLGPWVEMLRRGRYILMGQSWMAGWLRNPNVCAQAQIKSLLHDIFP